MRRIESESYRRGSWRTRSGQLGYEPVATSITGAESIRSGRSAAATRIARGSSKDARPRTSSMRWRWMLASTVRHRLRTTSSLRCMNSGTVMSPLTL